MKQPVLTTFLVSDQFMLGLLFSCTQSGMEIEPNESDINPKR